MQTRTATCAHEPKRLEAFQQVRICEDAATFLRHEFHAKAPITRQFTLSVSCVWGLAQ